MNRVNYLASLTRADIYAAFVFHSAFLGATSNFDTSKLLKISFSVADLLLQMTDDESAAASAAGEDGEAFKIIQFLIEGVLTAALGIFGILGNIVSIKVNSSKVD